MSVDELVQRLVKDAAKFAVGELKTTIDEAKSDTCVFIRHIGENSEEFLRMRANGEINNDEFKELMEDLVDLDKMWVRKISVDTKVRAEKVANGLQDLVLDKLMKLVL